MKFNVFTEMEYTVRSAGTLILNISALRTPHQTVLNESFTIEPYLKAEELLSANGENRLMRFEVIDKGNVKVTYKATVDNFYKITDHEYQDEIPVARFDTTILSYLFPSRY